jgi:phosphate:Na+ symporter
MALVLVVGFLLWVVMIPVLAETPGGEQINWFKLGMGLFGGLAFFLFGMEQMSDGLKAAAGETLKIVLAKLTKNRFMGAFTGALVTAVLNSSSVTTVLVVGFITAGLMTMSQSIGVIFGANIGSTMTAQIVAFNITQYALVGVIIGFLLLFTGKTDKTRHYGSMIMGLGLIFYGMGVMSEAMNPLRSYEPFLDLMVKMENPILGILVGAVFTALVQSSAATTGIAIVMASEGLMTLPAGIALAFGSNIGTCATAVLAAIGKPRPAVRAAAVHIAFNIAGVLLWVWFIDNLAEFVSTISPSYPELQGKERLAAEVPRELANAHTVFNVANTLIFIWFTTYFARFVQWLIPDVPEDEKEIVRPKYLDDALVDTPSLALQRVRMELGHMGDILKAMFAKVDEAFEKRDRDMFEEATKMDDQVDLLHEHILTYLSRVGKEPLTDKQDREMFLLMSALDTLESLGNLIQVEIVRIGHKVIDDEIAASDAMRVMLSELYDALMEAFESAVRAVKDDDQRAAQQVMAVKGEINHQIQEALRHQAEKLVVEKSRLPVLRVEMEVLDHMRRIYTLCKRLARTVLPKTLSRPEEG